MNARLRYGVLMSVAVVAIALAPMAWAEGVTMPAGLYVSVSLLKLDPTWDPIRHDLRFQALLKPYENVPLSVAGSSEVGRG